jgi:hypothetical protein
VSHTGVRARLLLGEKLALLFGFTIRNLKSNLGRLKFLNPGRLTSDKLILENHESFPAIFLEVSNGNLGGLLVTQLVRVYLDFIRNRY